MGKFLRLVAVLCTFMLLIFQFQNCSKSPSFTVAASANEVFGIKVGYGNLAINPEALGQTVVVEDEGFDFTHEVFKNKVIGQYEIKCTVTGGSVYNLDLTKSKSEIIANLQNPREDGCELVPLTTLPKAQKSFLDSHLAAWNNSVLNKSVGESPYFDEFEEYYDSFHGMGVNNLDRGGAGYHATFVSGLVAYNNPQTKIIAIDKNMAAFNDFEEITALNSTSCSTLVSNYQALADLLNDSDIKNALVQQPNGQKENALLDIYKTNNVTLHNKSFSWLSAPYTVAELIAGGCFGGISQNGYSNDPQLSEEDNIIELSKGIANWSTTAQSALTAVRAYILARSQIERDRYARVYSEVLDQVTQVRAAGNDEQNLAVLGDMDNCVPLPNEIIIGSINYERNLSTFTNYGNCVDFYMLGTSTVSTLPLGVLYAGSGTSYSAPLVIRLLSLTVNPNLTFAEKKQQLLSYGDSAGIVNRNYMLTNLAYTNDSEQVGRFAKMSSTNAELEFRKEAVSHLKAARRERQRDLMEMHRLFGN